MIIRAMTSIDLPAVLAIQHRCYPAQYHEPLAAFESKLRLSPATAWLALSRASVHEQDLAPEHIEAYLVTLPVDADHFPALHDATWQPPKLARWLYLHDLAVEPHHRGTGAGQRLIQHALQHARAQGLENLVLIAVQGSQPYWIHQGFRPQSVDHPALQAKLRTFGPDAHFMQRPTHP